MFLTFTKGETVSAHKAAVLCFSDYRLIDWTENFYEKVYSRQLNRQNAIRKLRNLFEHDMFNDVESEKTVFMGFKSDNPLNANPVGLAEFPREAYLKWWMSNWPNRQLPDWLEDEANRAAENDFPTDCLKDELPPWNEPLAMPPATTPSSSAVEAKMSKVKRVGRPPWTDDFEYVNKMKGVIERVGFTDDQKADWLFNWREETHRKHVGHDRIKKQMKIFRQTMAG